MADKVVDSLEKLRERVTCPLCQQEYKEPRKLPCQHSFCLACLQSKAEKPQGNDSIDCPTCLKPAFFLQEGVSSLPSNFHMNKLLEISQLFPTGQGDEEGGEGCPEHGKPLDIYCNTCQSPACHECVKRSHKEHDHHPTSDIYKSCKAELESVQKEVERCREDVSAACNAIEACKKHVCEQEEVVRKQIHQQNEQVKAMCDKATKELVDRVEKVTQGKLCALACQEEETTAHLAWLQSLEELTRQSVDRLTQRQLIQSMEKLVSQAKDACSQVRMVNNAPIEHANLTFQEKEVSKWRVKLGELVYTNLPHQCYVVQQEDERKVVRGETASFRIHVPALKGVNDSSLLLRTGILSHELTARDGSPLQISVSHVKQETYNISYTPVQSGPHRLRVTICGHDITGSPAYVRIYSVPVTQKGSLVKIAKNFKRPYGVAVSSTGTVIVSEQHGHCITMLKSQGKKRQSFGHQGDGPGELSYPCGIALTADDRILVADRDNHRVCLFSASGEFVALLGEKGSGPGQLLHPEAVAVSPGGEIMVADTVNHRISVFNPDYAYSHSFGQKGSKPGEFDLPCGLATDRQGKVYVADYINHRVQVFAPLGKSYITQISSRGHQGASSPTGITVDKADNLYVSKHDSYEISVYTSNGKLLTNIGCQDEKLTIPCGLAVDSSGELYVCDKNNSRLIVL